MLPVTSPSRYALLRKIPIRWFVQGMITRYDALIKIIRTRLPSITIPHSDSTPFIHTNTTTHTYDINHSKKGNSHRIPLITFTRLVWWTMLAWLRKPSLIFSGQYGAFTRVCTSLHHTYAQLVYAYLITKALQ